MTDRLSEMTDRELTRREEEIDREITRREQKTSRELMEKHRGAIAKLLATDLKMDVAGDEWSLRLGKSDVEIPCNRTNRPLSWTGSDASITRALGEAVMDSVRALDEHRRPGMEFLIAEMMPKEVADAVRRVKKAVAVAVAVVKTMDMRLFDSKHEFMGMMSKKWDESVCEHVQEG